MQDWENKQFVTFMNLTENIPVVFHLQIENIGYLQLSLESSTI